MKGLFVCLVDRWVVSTAKWLLVVLSNICVFDALVIAGSTTNEYRTKRLLHLRAGMRAYIQTLRDIVCLPIRVGKS